MSRYCAGQMLANVNVPSCQAIVRNLISKCMLSYIGLPKISDVKYFSNIWTHLYSLLYMNNMNITNAKRFIVDISSSMEWIILVRNKILN